MKIKRRIAVLAIIAGLHPMLEASATETLPSLEGNWEGATLVRPAEVEVGFVLKVANGTTESFQATISFPSQGPKEHPIDSLVFEGSHVAFVTIDESGVASAFQGEVQSDGSVAGTVKVQEKSYPFVMSRRSADKSHRAQPAVRPLSTQGDELLALFNQDADKVRLVMILAPTCGVCRMGAGLVQRYVLDKIDDPRVRVYVVWEGVVKEDSAQGAAKAAVFVPDERATHFWSADRFTGRTFQNAVGLEGSPAWDVVLIFPADRRWDAGAPPHPSDFMHNLPKRLPAEKTLNGEALAAQVRALLDRRTVVTAASGGR